MRHKATKSATNSDAVPVHAASSAAPTAPPPEEGFVSATSTSRYVKAPTDLPRFLVFDPSVPTFDRIQFGTRAMAALGTIEEWMDEAHTNRDRVRVTTRAAHQQTRRTEIKDCEREKGEGEVLLPSGSSHRRNDDDDDSLFLPPKSSVAFSTVGMPKNLRDLHTASLAEQRALFEQNQCRRGIDGLTADQSTEFFSPAIGLAFSHYCELRIITDVYHPARGQYGVFAKRSIPPGTTLTPYAGVIQFCNLNPSSRCYVMSHAHTMTMEIDGEFVGNFARFANDPRGVPVYATTNANGHHHGYGHNGGNHQSSSVTAAKTSDTNRHRFWTEEKGSPQETGGGGGLGAAFSPALLRPDVYCPKPVIHGAKATHNVEAKVCVSRFGECYTALVSCKAIGKGQEILLDYGKGHRLRSQRWTSFGDERALTRPRQTSCFPAPLLPASSPNSMPFPLSSLSNEEKAVSSFKRMREEEGTEEEEKKKATKEMNTVEAGIRLFWQCAHCGHHTHTSTYPTFVTLCDNCEAPRAANVALVAAYTPSSSSSRSSALSSRQTNGGDHLWTPRFRRREPIVSVFASENLGGVQFSSAKSSTDITIPTYPRATTDRCESFLEGGSSSSGNSTEKSSGSGHHVVVPPKVGGSKNKNHYVGATTTSTCSGDPPPDTPSQGEDKTVPMNVSSPSDHVIAARIPQDEAKFLCPQPTGNAAGATSGTSASGELLVNENISADADDNCKNNSNVDASTILLGRHFDPIALNPSNHWARDQTHRRLHHHQNGPVTTNLTYVSSSSSAQSSSPLSPLFSSLTRGDASSPTSPSSPHLLSSPLHHAAPLCTGGASAPTDIVSQTVLSEAHRFGITSIPAPFPLNFTLVPWHVHDSRVPLSEIRAAAPTISSEIQIQEVTESVKLRWWCWSSPPRSLPTSSPSTTPADTSALALPAAAAAATSSQKTILVGDHVKLCCTTTYYYTACHSVGGRPEDSGGGGGGGGVHPAKGEEAKASENDGVADVTDRVGLVETAARQLESNGCCLPIPSVGEHQRSAADVVLTTQEKEMNNSASIPVAVQDISITVSRMGIATAVRSDRKAWQRGEEVGVVGGLVLFASDPRVRQRMALGDNDDGHFQKERGTCPEGKGTSPTHRRHCTLEHAILDAVCVSQPQTKRERKKSSVSTVPVELCGAAHNPHVSSCFLSSSASSSSSSAHSPPAPAMPLHKAFFAIPLPHTSTARAAAVAFGRSLTGDQVGIGSGSGVEMVLLPTNEFAHIGVVPNKTTQPTGKAAVPPFSPLEYLGEPGSGQRALPFLRNAAFVADPNARPNITFVTSMDHLGCVFVAAIALAPISHTTELLVSESEVIMLY